MNSLTALGLSAALGLTSLGLTACGGPSEPVKLRVEVVEFDEPENTEFEQTKRSDGSKTTTIDWAESKEVTLNVYTPDGRFLGEYDADFSQFAVALGIPEHQLTEEMARQRIYETLPIQLGWFAPSQIDVIPVGDTVPFGATKDTDS